MQQNPLKTLLKTMEDIRSLSFRMHQNTENIKKQNKRINQIVFDVQETMNLSTLYHSRSKELSEKIDQIKQELKSAW